MRSTHAQRFLIALFVIGCVFATPAPAAQAESPVRIVLANGGPGWFSVSWDMPSTWLSMTVEWNINGEPWLLVGESGQPVIGAHGEPLYWNWPDHGIPMKCEKQNDIINDTCNGDRNLADAARSVTISDVAPGTYGVQITGWDPSPNPSGHMAEYFSSIVSVVVTAPIATTATPNVVAPVIAFGNGAGIAIPQGGKYAVVVCMPSDCPQTSELPIGSIVTTNPGGYVKVSTKQWGTILIGSNTTFVLSKEFADIAGGEVEFQFGEKSDGPCRVFVAPIPALGYKASKPVNWQAQIDAGNNNANCKGIDFEVQKRSVGITIDDIKGNATLTLPSGTKRQLKPAQEEQIVSGRLTPPVKPKLKTCDLQSIGFGVFC